MEGVTISACSTLFSLILFILISKSTTDCWTKEKSVDMTDEFDIEVGSPFALNCTLHNKSIVINEKKYYANASFISFKKGDNRIYHAEEHVINPLTSQLRVNVSKVEDSGFYNCVIKLPNFKNDFVICSSQVNVGYKPTPPVNFSCKIIHYKSLRCEWWTKANNVTVSSKIHRLPFTKFNITDYFVLCPHRENNSRNYWVCEWTLFSVPPFTSSTTDYFIVITTSNSLGSRNDTFKFHRNEIVLPGLPQFLRYHNLQPTSLKLEWQFPNDMDDFLPYLTYQLIYYKVNKSFEEDLKIINITSEEKNVFYNITNLIPHTQYKFEVRCRSVVSKGDDMWSKNASIIVQTKEDVPYTVPEIIKEAFEIQKSEDNYRITLYWKHVPEELRNGKNLYYIVTYTPANTSYEESEIVFYNNTCSPPLAHISFDNLDSNTAYKFKIYSANNVGISDNFSTIVVNKLDNLVSPPTDVSVISYDQNYYNVSWTPVHKTDSPITGYIVFWCFNTPGPYNPFSKPCNSSIYWKYVSPNTNFVKHQISDLQINTKFAVATLSEYSSSGMVWAPCLISYNDTIVKIREPFSLTANNVSAIHIAWGFDCNSQKALIKELHIIYCQTKDSQSDCTDKEYFHTLQNKNAEDYYITELSSQTYYRVSIRIITADGRIVDTSYQFVQTPADHMVIAIIVGVSFSCIILTFLVCCIVKWLKKKFAKIQEFRVKLPPGLNNNNDIIRESYENFKKGLSQQNTSLPSLKPRPGSFVLDNNKNRCVSILGNSSAEDLLYKNTKHCKTYWRNPSGDSSSGCSSNGIHDSISSSNTNRTHLSMDSGAELDLSPITAFDNVFCDPSLILKSDIHFKSEIDIQDDKSSDSGLDKEIFIECGTKAKKEQPTSTASFISPLNNQLSQYPYSKFGLNGTNSHYSKHWNNILTINYSLCNSEPSIINLNENFNNKNKSLALIPYSKVGISKSSESIDSFPKDNQEHYRSEDFVDGADKNRDSGLSPYVRTSLQHENNYHLNNVLKPYISMGSYFESILKVPNSKEDAPVNLKGNNSMAYSKFDIHPSMDVISSQVNPYIPVQQAHSMMQGVILPEINLNPSFDINIFNFNNNLTSGEFSVSDVKVGEELSNTNENFYSSKEHSINESACTYGCEKSCQMSDKEINLNSEDDVIRQKSEMTEDKELQTSSDCYAEEPYKKFKYVNGNDNVSEENNFEIIMAPQQLERIDCNPPYISPFRFENQSEEINIVSNENGYVHLPTVYYV